MQSTEQCLASSKLLTSHHISTQRVCPPLAPKEGGGYTHSPGGEGVGVNILEDARHWIGLLQYNSSTGFLLEAEFLQCCHDHLRGWLVEVGDWLDQAAHQCLKDQRPSAQVVTPGLSTRQRV